MFENHPVKDLGSPVHYCLALLLTLCLTLPAAAADEPAPARTFPVKPVAVVAVASLDRLLDDVDYVFGSAGEPQVADIVRGFLANLNDLQGLDRARPIGVYLYFRPLESSEPQPVLFFPVADIDDLVRSVRLGNALHLKKTDRDDRLTLVTEDGELPVGLHEGYAFIDPVGKGRWLDARLPRPADLIGASLETDDAVLIVRSEGVPQALVQLAAAGVHEASLKESQQKPEESPQEHQLRRGVSNALFGIVKQFIQEAESLSVGMRLSSDTRQAELQARLVTDRGKELEGLLSAVSATSSQFSGLTSEPAPFTLASNWQLTPGGQELLLQGLDLVREQVHNEIGRADETIRQTADDVLDAIESSIAAGQFDGYLQIVGGPPDSFSLVGGVSAVDDQALAAGLERFLPFANESSDVAALEMNVGQPEGVAIHRVQPRKLRKQDQRLYGTEASFYVGAGHGAVWFALGEDVVLDALGDALDGVAGEGGSVPDADETSLPLLTVAMHLTSWIGLAPTGGDGENARLARWLARRFRIPTRIGFMPPWRPPRRDSSCASPSTRGTSVCWG